MAMTGRTIIGVFDEAGMADRAINALQNAGYNNDQIYHSGVSVSGAGTDADTGMAGAGVGTGTSTASTDTGFWAGLKRFFTGGDTESATSVAHDLENMGVSDDEANYYENEYRNGHTIVAVRADRDPENVKSILQSNGAYNYASRMGGSGLSTTSTTTGASTAPAGMATDTTRTEYSTTDATNTGRTSAQAAYDINNDADTSDTVMPLNTTGYDASQAQAGTYTTTGTRGVDYTDTDMTQGRRETDYTDTGTDDTQRMRLREEQLNVEKQRVQTGEVGLHKEVVEEQKTVDVPVTHEQVYVERRPVTDATADNTPIGEGEEIRVPVSEEQVNVNKNTVVTGEVAVGKRAVQENQQVTDTVRREEARLDEDGNPRVTGTGLHNDMVDNTTDTNTMHP